MKKFPMLQTVLLAGWLAGWVNNAPAASQNPENNPALLDRALAGPMQGMSEIVLCTRLPYDDPHWYANIGYYCDDEQRKAYTGNGKPDAGKLIKHNLRTGQTTVLLDAQGGSIRDPQVHYDAQKILFSYRPAGTDYYHLYEIGVDGKGLRQITRGEFDDYEPIYLPDGGIAFVSTRCKRWVNCWTTQVGVIYRCDANGQNMEVISANTEHDNTPWMLPDGRILYTRWEYVDRSQVEYHHLWAMNPDGTGQMIYYGNMHSHVVMIDAKPIPDTDLVLANFSPGHGVNEHAGIATIVSPQRGPDDRGMARALHKGKLIKDPYPVAANCYLVARDNQVVLLDDAGQSTVVYTHAGPGLVHEPRPIMPRQRERLIPRRTRPDSPIGHMFMADVYHSRNLPGVKRGEIKKLLVLESLPKPVNFSGGPDLVSWLGTFTLERVVGTVPVEADGSAYFEVPANRQLFFVALDEHDLSVKRMQSFTCAMPGEVVGCVGCHEPRAKTPETKSTTGVLAMRRPASRIEPFTGHPDVLDFTRDVQPILNQHCVRCHDYQEHKGNVILAGDLGPLYSHSFFSLFAHRQIADGRNGLGNQPPRTIGSSASALLRKVSGEHHDVKVSAAEWRTLWLWIESGAPYAGTYAGLRNERDQNRAAAAAIAIFNDGAEVLQRRCKSCHETGDVDTRTAKPLPFGNDYARQRRNEIKRPVGSFERIVFENDPIARFSPNVLLNFTRPELSPLLLGPLATNAGGFASCGAVFANPQDPDYQQLLAALQRAKRLMDEEPRFGTPDFRPNHQYVRELKKYGVLPADFDVTRQRLDVFAADQEYWRSLWPRTQLTVSRHE